MADTLTHESHFTGQAGERLETLYHCRRAHIGTPHVLFRRAAESKLAPSSLRLEPPRSPLTPTGAALVKTVNGERRGEEVSAVKSRGMERREEGRGIPLLLQCKGWDKGNTHHTRPALGCPPPLLSLPLSSIPSPPLSPLPSLPSPSPPLPFGLQAPGTASLKPSLVYAAARGA